MKMVHAFLAVVTLGLLGGCASDPDKAFGEEMMRITPIEPPTFLTAEFASLFGKANFSARAEVQRGLVGSRPPQPGELSSRDGSLFFIADEQRSGRGFAGGLSALWDNPSQTAYLLNEPLQAYAPIRNSGTNAPLEATVVGDENVGSEHCRKSIVSRRIGTELIPAFIVWRGIAQEDLPLKIQTTNSPSGVTVTLSRVRFQSPPAELFTLPDGFKRFDTTDTMIGELLRRRGEAVSARSKARRERYGGPRSYEDDEPVSSQRPTRPY